MTDPGGTTIERADLEALALIALYVARDLDVGDAKEATAGARLARAFGSYLRAQHGEALQRWIAGVPLGDRIAPALARVRSLDHRPWCTYLEELEGALRYAVLEQRAELEGRTDDRH